MRQWVNGTLAVAAISALVACASTTDKGTVGADRRQLLLVSEPQVADMANKAYARVLNEARKAGTLNTDVAQLKRVREIAAKLIPQVKVFRPDAINWRWETNVITADTLNAWCMHGGKIAVYTGIITKLNLTDDELAAIIGHEMAHALREHSREQISQGMAATLALNIGTSLLGLGSLGNNIAQLGSDLMLKLPNSRTHETEADRMGVELAARAGYDPRAAISLWRKMGALSPNNGQPSWLSTHPSGEARIADLEVYAAKVVPLFRAAKERQRKSRRLS
jgi:Zn-dependent protease with chaperone function